MQQLQFVVGENGLLSELAASEQAEWYAANFPEADAIDFEAHTMLTRAFDALKTEAPLEHRGGLTKARYNVLRMLYVVPDQRLLMTDIVQTMNVSPTNITKLVDGLERDAFVRRAGSLNDKRKVWVELLPKGSKALEEAMPDVVHHVAILWQGLTLEEKRVLIHLLSKLRLDIMTRGAEELVENLSSQLPTPVRASA